MKASFLSVISFSLLSLLLLTVFLSKSAFSAADHVVISEVQIGGGTPTDEFVELYNPTGSPVDLTGWKLMKKTASGTEFTLIANLTGSINARGYYLVAHTDYDGVNTEDITYSEDSYAASNAVLLRNGSDAPVDKVGFGTALDFEADAEPNPDAGTSRERKALVGSTSATMAVGGLDEFLGNGEDTDNNDADFNGRAVPEPQNSESSAEPALPSPSPSSTTTATATATATASPTVSSSPTSSPTPTPTPTPTASPTASPTPSPTPEPTVTPSPTPSSTPFVVFETTRSRIECRLEYKVVGSRFFRFLMPMFSCHRVPLD